MGALFMSDTILSQIKNTADDTAGVEGFSDSEIVLSAENVKRHYQGARSLFKNANVVKALDGVSFEAKRGKTLAVVGESGCGKSTLAKSLTMIEEPTSGVLRYKGQILSQMTKHEKKEIRQKIQMIFQNPYAALNPRKKIGTILEEPLLINTKLTKSERKARALSMLATVGLKKEHYSRYPHMFSGGQRQRIVIARSLMLSPDIIVADEPVSALDVSVQAQVLNLMMDLQLKHKLSYIFISHDLSVVRHIAHEVIVMYLGKVVEQANTKDLFDAPKHPYTKALLSSVPTLEAKAVGKERIRLQGELPSPLNPPAGCAFHTRCPFAKGLCENTMPDLQEKDKKHLVACHFA